MGPPDPCFLFFCLHDNAYLGLLQLVFLLDAALLRSLAHEHLPVHIVASSIDTIHDAGNLANWNNLAFFLSVFISHKSFHELHGMRLFGVGRIMNPEFAVSGSVSVVLFHINVVDGTEFKFFELESYIFHSGQRKCFGNENGCHVIVCSSINELISILFRSVNRFNPLKKHGSA